MTMLFLKMLALLIVLFFYKFTLSESELNSGRAELQEIPFLNLKPGIANIYMLPVTERTKTNADHPN